MRVDADIILEFLNLHKISKSKNNCRLKQSTLIHCLELL